MKLNKTITLIPPPYTDGDGNLITPLPIKTDNLNVTFHIDTTSKTVFATIVNIPRTIMLAGPDDFDSVNMITPAALENTLLQEMGTNIEEYLQQLFPRTLESDPHGPGTILSGMLSVLGIKAIQNCPCRRHAIEMNTKGPDWCEENIDTILGWLKEESSNRNLPFVETVAKLMVQRAINKSRRLLKKHSNAK